MSLYEGVHSETFEIEAAVAADADERSRNPHTPLDEVRRSWLLRPKIRRLQRRINLGCTVVTQKVFLGTLASVLAAAAVLVGLSTIAKTIPGHNHQQLPPPDNYMSSIEVLPHPRSGKLLTDNNISYLGDFYTCLPQTKDLIGGYFDDGDSVKFHFLRSFSMTRLSWSVIEFSSEYEVAGQFDHVKEVIKWGIDYFLKCFDEGVETIGKIASQVGMWDNRTIPKDHYCWMRPEDIDYFRHVTRCTGFSDLAAEMAAVLASASIIYKDDKRYSENSCTMLVCSSIFQGHGLGGTILPAPMLSCSIIPTSYWHEYIWGLTGLYYATGDSSYLSLAMDLGMAKCAGVFSVGRVMAFLAGIINLLVLRCFSPVCDSFWNQVSL